MKTSRALLALSLFTLLAVRAARASDVPPEWLTPAETAAFEATPSLDETRACLARLAGRWPALRLTEYGTSGAGRGMPLAIVSADGTFSPVAAARSGKTVLLIQSGIHSGEIDGKDASLMLLRDIALGRVPVPRSLVLLFVPIYNVDGHERVSPFNRPNQDGPRKGMGFRTTAAGLDLNRDHLKLDSAEARALVALVNAWRPHLHVDNHVTDGCEFAWTLTYGTAEAPQAPPAIDAWLHGHLPAVLKAVEAAGFGTGPYVSLVDGKDPSKGFDSWSGGGRFSTGYFALRNRPSILVEMHSYKPYRERVLGNRAFLAALIAEVAKDPKALRDAVLAAEHVTVEEGRPGAPPSTIDVRIEDPKEADRITFPVYEWTTAVSTVTGKEAIAYRRGKIKPLEVPWYHRTVVGLTAPRPRGYVLLPGWAEVEKRLLAHGLRTERLRFPVTLDATEFRASAPKFEKTSYQGRVAVTATITTHDGPQTFPAGSLFIPADQPDFAVAVQLLEPQSDDSLFHWGFFDSVMEGKEYIDTRNLEGLAREMLKDPAVAKEWETALADPEFAKDTSARYDWWYRRTPYYDKQKGQVPVFRALKRP